jgi:CRISP-associated protein Cas1
VGGLAAFGASTSLAKSSEGRHGPNVAIPGSSPGTDPISDADADAESDAFWEARLAVKPRVVTTVTDNASFSIRGGSLNVRDGERRLRYDPGSRLPSAIVMAGWGGVITIEAIRFCGSYGVAIIALDWMRELMAVMPSRPSDNAALLRAQAFADPTPIAVRIVQAKVASAARAGAIEAADAARFIQAATHARSVQEAMIIEAQAARLAWPSLPVFRWRVGSPRIPPRWKVPPSTRSRAFREARMKRRATHPLNALLNVVFSVTVGRIAVALAARGAHPAIGFLHADARGRYSLAFDTIEPLRPHIEKAVFAFARQYQFSANDFIRIKDAQGSIRLADLKEAKAVAEATPQEPGWFKVMMVAAAGAQAYAAMCQGPNKIGGRNKRSMCDCERRIND